MEDGTTYLYQAMVSLEHKTALLEQSREYKDFLVWVYVEISRDRSIPSHESTQYQRRNRANQASYRNLGQSSRCRLHNKFKNC